MRWITDVGCRWVAGVLVLAAVAACAPDQLRGAPGQLRGAPGQLRSELPQGGEATQDRWLPSPVGFRGADVRIGISGGGVQATHPAFATAGGHRVIVSRETATDLEHGTQVASIVAGAGHLGVAPRALLGDFDRMTGVRHFAAALAPADPRLVMDVVNHSYSYPPVGGRYTRTDLLIDRVVAGKVTFEDRKLPARAHVFAAGNTRAGPGGVKVVAKNPIVVGSVDFVGTDGLRCTGRNCRITDRSGYGPTVDGRIKPDVVAIGCHSSPFGGLPTAWSFRYADEPKYGRGDCGTSFAAPVVTGTIALMIEADRVEPPTISNPSTFKAILVQTANDVVTDTQPRATAGPDYVSGFGLIDVIRATSMAGKSELWHEGEILASGTVDEFCLLSTVPGKELRATLAWDDAPTGGCADRGDAQCTDVETASMVSDLDLTVVGPDGERALPWVLDPGKPAEPARRGVDRRNNVEVVDAVATDGSGGWRIRVSGYRLAEAQRYSLVASTKIRRCASVR